MTEDEMKKFIEDAPFRLKKNLQLWLENPNVQENIRKDIELARKLREERKNGLLD